MPTIYSQQVNAGSTRKGRLAHHCLEQFVERVHRFRECTCHTRFGVLGRSRGAPCAGHTAQTAALRCVKIAQEHVRLTQGASVCVSWSLAAIRLLELCCWMMQLSLCKKFCLSTIVRMLAFDIPRSRKETKKNKSSSSPQVQTGFVSTSSICVTRVMADPSVRPCRSRDATKTAAAAFDA